MPPELTQRQPFPLASAIGLFIIGFIILGWPWFSGAVTIPYDGKSTFYTQFSFLARSLADGQSPFWTPNVYAGWPQIADPQSLIFSPLHLLVALLDPTPSFQAADGVVFAYLFLGGLGVILVFRERGWHAAGAVAAAFAFAFGGANASRIQHIGEVESLAFLPLTFWFLMRALERSSWRAGLGAGLCGAVVVLGRDQVSLIALYVLAGFVLWHWLDGPRRGARFMASLKPLAAGAAAGVLLVTVPVVLSILLAADSNRPEIGLVSAGRGSLHPAHLLMLVFANAFGASDFNLQYWGPPSFPWRDTFGDVELYIAQNMGQVYSGALVAVAVLSFGLVRGVAWAREIRFYMVATVLVVLYALGRYTPAFTLMYELLPGVSLFRRPADATFVFCATLSIVAGYLVHRWVTDTVPVPRRWQRALEVLIGAALIAIGFGLAAKLGVFRQATVPMLEGIGFLAAACAALYFARRLAAHGALAPAILLTMFSVADLRFNNAPNESTGLPPAQYEAMRSDTSNETVQLLKAKLAAAAVAAPNRRDRVELVGLGYHWPNIGLIHGFDHVLGHNPLRFADFERATAALDTIAVPDQRKFSPLLASYRSPLESLFGVRFIASSVPIEQVDTSYQRGDLTFIARTPDAYVYENPRALPRILLVSDWRVADFEQLIRYGGWPEVDLARTVLLEQPPAGMTPSQAGGTARIVRYRNTEVVVDVEAPAGGFLILNDIWHPWWRASLDGAPIEILKANVLFRAVRVPSGRHAVRFTFQPFAGALAELRSKLGGSKVAAR